MWLMPKFCASSINFPNFIVLLHSMHGFGVSPARYASMKGFMTFSRNSAFERKYVGTLCRGARGYLARGLFLGALGEAAA